jgi:hypothetical protein
MAWPNDGQNKAPSAARIVSVADGDREYINALVGKAYIAREFLALHIGYFWLRQVT